VIVNVVDQQMVARLTNPIEVDLRTRKPALVFMTLIFFQQFCMPDKSEFIERLNKFFHCTNGRVVRCSDWPRSSVGLRYLGFDKSI
jgi:hypothetical protein